MSSQIHSEDLHSESSQLSSSTSIEVLRGEIDGLRTISHSVAPGQTVQLDTSPKEGRVYLFTAGNGTADDGTTVYQIGEVALLAPCHAAPLTVEATGSPLLFLELVLDLSPVDVAELERNAERFPLFISYSDCKTYSERIKSDKTVSRTLMPEYTFPRLCVGSVETTGDDRVAAHEHPMLEQLFLGLQDNDCVLHADAAELAFGAGVLLHVPLGSRHGVVVHAPNKLHYIWIDLFKNRDGMEWIVQEHIQTP